MKMTAAYFTWLEQNDGSNQQPPGFKIVNMNLMNKMMLSCVKATELMELQEVVPLSVTKKIQLKMHVAVCSGCRNYMKQTKIINMHCK